MVSLTANVSLICLTRQLITDSFIGLINAGLRPCNLTTKCRLA